MNEFLRKIVGVSLMLTLLEMALPEGEARRYVLLGAELWMMLCALRLIASFFRGLQ